MLIIQFTMKLLAGAILLSLQQAATGNLLSKFGSSKPDMDHRNDHETFAPALHVNSDKAIPTNTWWGNLIHLQPGEDKNKAALQPVWSNPYMIKIQKHKNKIEAGIHASYSFDHRIFGPASGNGVNGIKHYRHDHSSDIVFSAKDVTEFKLKVDNWDVLGVDIELSANGGSLKSSLVKGMPFVTGVYENLIPKLASRRRILKVNHEMVHSEMSIEENKLVLEFERGKKWVVYLGKAIRFQIEDGALVANEPYFGTVRVAKLDPGMDENVLDDYSSCIVNGGQLIIQDEYTYGWTFSTSGNCKNGLMHLGLYHHTKTILPEFGTPLNAIQYESATRGKMYGLVTKSFPFEWRFLESEEVKVDFYANQRIDPSIVAKYNIRQLLMDEIHEEWKIKRDGSYYFTGKQLQKYASLCLMADDELVVKDGKKLLSECGQKLQTALSMFLDNSWQHPLVYDTVYRGVISSQSFAHNDMFVDFGNSVYNDHHYHYSYYITTCAIAYKLFPEWTRNEEFKTKVEYLIRDVANPNESEDPYFPEFRHFDWYLGHSYSHGVTPFADGKDQESTSEDINFDYGLLLWGKATGNSKMESLAKLLLKVNARAIQLYFLMDDDNPIHPAQIVANKVTGIFFDNKVDYATWFSPEKYCIHGIQMLPVSPANEMTRTKKFVAQEWDQILSKESIVQTQEAVNAWQSLLFSNYAMVNQQVALDRLSTVPMDDGLTRAWALYMAATRS